MGLPSVVVVTADNQRLIAERVIAAGAAVGAGDWTTAQPDAIAQAVLELAGDNARRNAMVQAAARIVDAGGALRVAQAVGNAA
jgi:spore coat polysaccharide biosynthesis predicted glycosyltransferase SpsG